MVPGFILEREIGRGGMGVVYKARHSATQRVVALKIIHNGAYASPQYRARLRTEAEAISRLDHPHIVKIFEVGEHQDQPFLAMEYIDGGSLDQHLVGRPAPADLAARFVRNLALAVQHTHEQQIIHRDLKPANILMEGGARFAAQTSEIHQAATVDAIHPLTCRPRITDFGLAKLLDANSTAWTQAGAVLGTANYMSPEQAEGRVTEIGPASDIYSLGAILYEILVGRPPFQGATWSDTILKVIREEPEPLKDIPSDLESICLKCLEKSPIQRYASALDLAEDLERFTASQPVKAAPATEKERIAKRAAREGYTLLEEIGRGPGSTVYRATHGPMQQVVALKTFRRGAFQESVWFDRVKSITQTSALISHPQVAIPREAGWWDGVAFVVMDFTAQGTLADAIASQRYSLRSALKIVEQLAEVICYLHRQGVVHGNLKPSNILLAADGIPRLVDFRVVSSTALENAVAEANVQGLAYLAPEFVDAPAVEPLPVADIYGLGMILYELLTGAPPFTGTGEEIREQIRSVIPESIRTRHFDLPPEIDDLVKKCLRKKPFWRPARAYDFLTTIRKVRRIVEGPSLRG